MKSSRPVFRASRKHTLLHISSFVLSIVLLGLAPSQAIAQIITFDSLKTQADVDAFRQTHGILTTINGSLVIDGGDLGGPTAIKNLDSLVGITTIMGNLKLIGLDSIVDISGLASMKTIRDSFDMIGNDVLSDLTGLDKLESVGGRFSLCCTGGGPSNLEHLGSIVTIGGQLRLCCSSSFNNTEGMDALTSVGGSLEISAAEFIEINGFPSLKHIHDSLSIRANTAETISGFPVLKTIANGLRIEAMSDLGAISGFSSLDSVGGNVTLKNISALSEVCGLFTLLNTVDDGSPGPGGATPDVGGSVIFENSGAFTSLADVLAHCDCSGFSIEIPNVCDCDDPIPVKPLAKGLPADDRMLVTVKINAPSGQNWTVKAVNGLYSTSSPAAPADPVLIALGIALTDIGGDMHALDVLRLTTAGYWIQVTNGSCDLDIQVGNPDPCAVPEVCDGQDNDCDNQIDEGGVCCTTNGLPIVTLPDGSTLYVHPTDNSTNIQWGGTGIDIPGLDNKPMLAAALTDFAGENNTAAIVAHLGANNGTPYAAKLCANLVANGCDDWYLPAVGELQAMYEQLGPGGNNDFADDNYWTSTEIVASGAYAKGFDTNAWYGELKFMNHRCRCVRK